MNADYSWLYSAIAQSCAAIVGIFGAFLLTKVVAAQAAFAGRKETLKQLTLTAHNLRDRAQECAFGWYNDRTIESDLDRLSSDLEREDEFKSPEHYYNEQRFSPFIRRGEVIHMIEGMIGAEKRRREARNNPHADLLGRRDLADMGRSMRFQMQPSLAHSVQEERDKIERLAIDIRHHCRLLTQFLTDSRRHPESSPLVTVSSLLAILLFFVGVVWPLSFLPVEPGKDVTISLDAVLPTLLSLKGAILSAISTVFVAIVVVFGWINSRLRLSDDQLHGIASFANVSAYSEYLARECPACCGKVADVAPSSVVRT